MAKGPLLNFCHQSLLIHPEIHRVVEFPTRVAFGAELPDSSRAAFLFEVSNREWVWRGTAGVFYLLLKGWFWENNRMRRQAITTSEAVSWLENTLLCPYNLSSIIQSLLPPIRHIPGLLMGKWQMSNFNLEADKTDAPKSILRHRRARLMTRL